MLAFAPSMKVGVVLEAAVAMVVCPDQSVQTEKQLYLLPSLNLQIVLHLQLSTLSPSLNQGQATI